MRRPGHRRAVRGRSTLPLARPPARAAAARGTGTGTIRCSAPPPPSASRPGPPGTARPTSSSMPSSFTRPRDSSATVANVESSSPAAPRGSTRHRTRPAARLAALSRRYPPTLPPRYPAREAACTPPYGTDPPRPHHRHARTPDGAPRDARAPAKPETVSGPAPGPRNPRDTPADGYVREAARTAPNGTLRTGPRRSERVRRDGNAAVAIGARHVQSAVHSSTPATTPNTNAAAISTVATPTSRYRVPRFRSTSRIALPIHPCRLYAALRDDRDRTHDTKRTGKAGAVSPP